MEMTFKEIAKVIQKRYKISMASANQTTKDIIDDLKYFKRKYKFETEEELNKYLTSTDGGI